MLLDDLVKAIETVQTRIREHGNTLSQNEYRTRISLIDPILNALGWDVSDPSLVTHEYAVGSGRADYALLGSNGNPTAFIEAKRLGEMADASRHETQLFTYAVTQGVRYAGLTDGDRWLFDNLTARFSGGESRLLDVTISKESAHICALALLLLWHPTLAYGQPTSSKEPVIAEHAVSYNTVKAPAPSMPAEQPLASSSSSGWISLASYRPKEGDVVAQMLLRFPDETERQIKHWWGFQAQVAEWLIQTGILTSRDCPVGRRSGWNLIHTEAQHQNGRPFFSEHKLSNGLFLEKNANRFQHVENAKYLLRNFSQDPASILLKPN